MQVTSTAESFNKVIHSSIRKWHIVGLIFIFPMLIIISFPNWQLSQWLISLIMDTGATFDGRTIRRGVLAMGRHVAGIIVGGTNVFGAFVVGINACGIAALGPNAVGVLAALSDTQRVKGKYLFTPHRRDIEAIVFFTRGFPKLAAMQPYTDSNR